MDNLKGAYVNKFYFCLLFLISNLVFAQNYTLSTNNQNFFENRQNWTLKRSGESHTIQNISGKPIKLDLWVDKFITGSPSTLSDTVYVLCGQLVQQVSGGTGIVCDIPYPGVAMIVAYPFINGSSGQFSINL